MAGRKAALGWEPRGKEDDDRALERRTVLRAMGELAGDPATLAEAEKITQKWLKDPVERRRPTRPPIAVPLASIRAGAARLDELRAAVEQREVAGGPRARHPRDGQLRRSRVAAEGVRPRASPTSSGSRT